MKAILLLVVFVVAAFAIPSDEDLKIQFGEFLAKYKKAYHAEEFNIRFNNFKASVARVEKMMASKPSATYGITKFSDMSVEEFRATVLMTEGPKKGQKHTSTIGATVASPDAPDTFDWRDHNAVTPVKNQGQCGSCWAFSATEATESAWILKGHATPSTISLSPQQIVDCDSDGVAGCNGGRTESAYEYIVKAGGLESITDYPYTAKNGKCQFDKSDVVASISGYNPVSSQESALPTNLASIGPLSICLDAAHWQDYQSGVMTNTECCPLLKCTMDHCVQLVGYNTTASTPYYMVRNSWATDWGVDGYIWLEMNKNTCGLTNDITWPTSN